MAKKLKSLLAEIDKKFKESEEVSSRMYLDEWATESCGRGVAGGRALSIIYPMQIF